MKITDIGQSKLDQKQTGEARLQDICSKHGFLNASYAHIDASQNLVHGFTTFPAHWCRHYIENNLIQADPLIRYGANTIAPMDWAVFATQPEFTPLFEAAAKFGVGTKGISIPVISPFGERGIFSVSGNHEQAEWEALVAPILSNLRHEAQILHLLALDVIDTAISFPNEPLSSEERQVLRLLAMGVAPNLLSTQTGYTPGMVEVLINSITVKLKSRSIEQAVGRAVAVGLIRWTDFFANPVVEVAARDRGVLLGGIVNWAGHCNEIIVFDESRAVRNLESFSCVSPADLSAKYHIPIDKFTDAFGHDDNGDIWVRYL